jgi:hypothetical protein
MAKLAWKESSAYKAGDLYRQEYESGIRNFMNVMRNLILNDTLVWQTCILILIIQITIGLRSCCWIQFGALFTAFPPKHTLVGKPLIKRWIGNLSYSCTNILDLRGQTWYVGLHNSIFLQQSQYGIMLFSNVRHMPLVTLAPFVVTLTILSHNYTAAFAVIFVGRISRLWQCQLHERLFVYPVLQIIIPPHITTPHHFVVLRYIGNWVCIIVPKCVIIRWCSLTLWYLKTRRGDIAQWWRGIWWYPYGLIFIGFRV